MRSELKDLMRHKTEAVRTEPESVIPSWHESDLATSGMADAILEVGGKRKALLDRMRGAFEQGDNEQALNLGRQLCGFSNDQEESARTQARVN